MARTNRRRLETAAVANLVVLEAFGDNWETSDLICQRAGIPRTQARRAAARLAESGALQRRDVEWVSGKSRVRRRAEYRRPVEDQPLRPRLPEWAEPTVHPVNPQHCRFVTGRASQKITKECQMTESDINDLPQAVRSRYRDIPDNAFNDHPEVAAVLAQLEELEAQHREAAANSHKIRNQLQGLEQQAAWARGEASRLADGRPRRLADILLSGDHDLAQDHAVLKQINDLLHFSDCVELVYPKDLNKRPKSEMARREAQADRATRSIVQSMEGVQDRLQGLIDQLRLAEAERLAFA